MHLPRLMSLFLCGVIIWLSFDDHFFRYRYCEEVKHLMDLPRAGIYITNAEPWLTTVTGTTRFLNEHLAKEETFLALPSEELYYFLTDKESPTRQQELGIRITREQEKDMIAAMGTKKVKYVLMSNRIRSPDVGLGPFGVDYGRLLADYINRNYTTVAVAGDWDKDPGWFNNHAVKIMERIQ